MTEDVLKSQEGKKPSDQEEVGSLKPNIEVVKSAWGTESQFHVYFRDTSGQVTAVQPAPPWAHELYLMYEGALHRAEAAEENLAMEKRAK